MSSKVEAAQLTSHQRLVDAFNEGIDNEDLRRARIDAQFKVSPVHEEMAAALDRDPSLPLTAHNRIVLEGYLMTKQRATAARELIARHAAGGRSSSALGAATAARGEPS